MDARIQSQHFVVQILLSTFTHTHGVGMKTTNWPRHGLLSLNWRNARQKFQWFIIHACVHCRSDEQCLFCYTARLGSSHQHTAYHMWNACTRTMHVHFTYSITFIVGRIRIILNNWFWVWLKRLALSSHQCSGSSCLSMMEDPSLNHPPFWEYN